MFDDSATGRQQQRHGVKAVNAALLGACTPMRGTLGFLQRRGKASVGKREQVMSSVFGGWVEECAPCRGVAVVELALPRSMRRDKETCRCTVELVW